MQLIDAIYHIYFYTHFVHSIIQSIELTLKNLQIRSRFFLSQNMKNQILSMDDENQRPVEQDSQEEIAEITRRLERAY